MRMTMDSLQYVLFLVVGFLTGWASACAFYLEEQPEMIRAVSESPASEALERASPMDEPLWYRELLKGSAARHSMQPLKDRPVFVRGYW